MKRKLYELKNARTKLLDEAEQALTGGNQTEYEAKMEKVKDYNGQIEQVEKLLAEKDRSFGGGDVPPVAPIIPTASEIGLTELRKSKEYKMAWFEAVKNGIQMNKGAGISSLAPLYKALTLSGGATPGEDGGFLAPIDFELRVIELMKDYLDFGALVNVENVSAKTGWRNIATAGTATPLPKVEELAAIGKTAQPAFHRVNFSTDTYADRLVVSKQLANDVDALTEYLAGWWAIRKALTVNKLVIDLIKTHDFTPLSGATDAAQIKLLKNILNVQLKRAHSKNAEIVTNQSGYDTMDNWVDETGRAILVPSLTSDFHHIKGRPVHYCDNDLFDTVEVGEEDAATEYNPMAIGNFKAFATLFVRSGMVLDATDVGGDAWSNYALEFRAASDMCIREVDPTAVIYTGFEVQ